MVADAETRVAIGVIRSLGRAGYPVYACSSKPAPLGYRSRYVHASHSCPPYTDPDFIAWLRDFVTRYDIRCIIPGESLMLALRPVYDEFSSLLPYSSDENLTYRGLSKFDVFEYLERSELAAHNLAPHVFVDSGRRPDAHAFAAMSKPLFIKTDRLHARGDGLGIVRSEATAETAAATARLLLDQYDKVLVQGYVQGIAVGAFLLRWNGSILADFMHMRLHELPDTGVSSYRRSWWHPEIIADARAKLEALNWQGVAMMEYRWDGPNGRFALLEMNGRFWGSIHLALFGGVDFPSLLVDAFHGGAPEFASGESARVRARHTFPLEVRYLELRCRDPKHRVWSCFRDMLEFFLLMIDPRVRADMLFPGDRRLYWLRMRQYMVTSLRRLKDRFI